MFGDDVLDLAREHVEPTGDDHVLGAVDDEPEPVFVFTRDVAGVQPAVGGERLRGLLGQIEVTTGQ